MEQSDTKTDFIETEKGKRPRLKKWAIRAAVFGVVALALIYLTPWFLYRLSHESTDDAYVTGTVVPVSAEVNGKVTRVFISDNQWVNAGDPLFQIQQDDYSAREEQAAKALETLIAGENQIQALLQEGKESLAEAKANLGSAKAQEDFADQEKNRYDELVKKHLVSENQNEQVVAQWRVAKARTEAAQAAVSKAKASVESLEAQLKTQGFKIQEAQATLDLTKIKLHRTLVVAPVAGRIANKNVDKGKYVQPGQPVLALVEKDIWVVANFKETQIKKMRVGQPVELKVDAYPGYTFKGRVESFQPGTGAVFSLLPPENATGNFVKVVQRVPVKITLDGDVDPAHPLWPGLSATPYVNVGEGK